MAQFEIYSTTQWVFFFYVYCFLGWLWESGYVSAKSHEFVNRGFMHGPFLPIYGSGAIVILLSTVGVRDNLWLIFFFGMVSSTILEYCTGASMEKLFHVRYWDYSKNRLNLNGHICMFVSIAWGLFSLLLVRIIHPPIEDLILSIPIVYIDIATLLITMYACVDMTISVNEALDLKATLIKLAESNEELRRIQDRVNATYAFTKEEALERKEEFEQMLKERQDAFSLQKNTRKQNFLNNLEIARMKKDRVFEDITERIERNEIVKQLEKSDIAKRVAEQKNKMSIRTDKEYTHSYKILRRNPGAVSTKHGDAMNEIMEMIKTIRK